VRLAREDAGMDGELGRVEAGDGSEVVLRRATASDVPELAALMADDEIGADRETADLAPYEAAFRRVDPDPAQLLVVAVDPDAGRPILGTLQLSVIPGMARAGALRGQIEAVRVSSAVRGRGLGTAMIGWAVDEARRRGCSFVQLTTDKRRHDAHRFYARLGFVASHEGFKRQL
jgi:GNAT superfamily N-acetyltransferase